MPAARRCPVPLRMEAAPSPARRPPPQPLLHMLTAPAARRRRLYTRAAHAGKPSPGAAAPPPGAPPRDYRPRRAPRPQGGKGRPRPRPRSRLRSAPLRSGAEPGGEPSVGGSELCAAPRRFAPSPGSGRREASGRAGGRAGAARLPPGCGNGAVEPPERGEQRPRAKNRRLIKRGFGTVREVRRSRLTEGDRGSGGSLTAGCPRRGLAVTGQRLPPRGSGGGGGWTSGWARNGLKRGQERV